VAKMARDELSQYVERWLARPCVADACEVGGKVMRVHRAVTIQVCDGTNQLGNELTSVLHSRQPLPSGAVDQNVNGTTYFTFNGA
jgi:hypothetical protein